MQRSFPHASNPKNFDLQDSVFEGQLEVLRALMSANRFAEYKYIPNDKDVNVTEHIDGGIGFIKDKLTEFGASQDLIKKVNNYFLFHENGEVGGQVTSVTRAAKGEEFYDSKEVNDLERKIAKGLTTLCVNMFHLIKNAKKTLSSFIEGTFEKVTRLQTLLDKIAQAKNDDEKAAHRFHAENLLKNELPNFVESYTNGIPEYKETAQALSYHDTVEDKAHRSKDFAASIAHLFDAIVGYKEVLERCKDLHELKDDKGYGLRHIRGAQSRLVKGVLGLKPFAEDNQALVTKLSELAYSFVEQYFDALKLDPQTRETLELEYRNAVTEG